MPLNIADPGSIGSEHLKKVPEDYLIFYSSPIKAVKAVEGELWCPDCRDVESLISDLFQPDDGPSGLIVYVGDRSQWKAPSNPFRGEPWHLTDIPTIIKKADGTRLAMDEIRRNLSEFIFGKASPCKLDHVEDVHVSSHMDLSLLRHPSKDSVDVTEARQAK